VLLDRFRDIPRARHSCRKGDKITRLDRDWGPAAVWRDHHLSFQQVAGLGFAVRPGELGDAAAPRAPVKDALLFQKFWIGCGNHLDFGSLDRSCHSCGGTRTNRRVLGCNKGNCGSNKKQQEGKDLLPQEHAGWWQKGSLWLESFWGFPRVSPVKKSVVAQTSPDASLTQY